MGLKSAVMPTGVPPVNAGTPAVAPKAIAPATTTSPKTSEVKGQVAMHAAIGGLRAAALLAPTLAASPEKVEETWLKLAAIGADFIERRTFKGE